MNEVMVLAALAGGGSALLAAAGVHHRVLLVAAALPVGIGWSAAFGTALLLLNVPQGPRGILLIATTAAFAAALVRLWPRRLLPNLIPVGLAALIHGAGAALLRAIAVVNLTPDSYQYVASGQAWALDHGLDRVPAHLVESRHLALPFLHGLATEPIYLASLSAFAILSGAAILAWVGWRLLGVEPWTPATSAAVIVMVIVLLLTNNRVIHHAFYVNAHGLTATLAVVIAGVCLLALRGIGPTPPAVGVLLTTASIGMITLRPDGIVLVGILLAPWLTSVEAPVRLRAWTCAAIGSVALAWSAVVARAFTAVGLEVPVGALGIGVPAAALLLLGPLLLVVGGRSWLPRVLWPGHVGLWVVLYLAHRRRPGILRPSVEATVANVAGGKGFWGLSLIILAGLLAVAVVLRRWPHQGVVVFPLLSFVPVTALLAIARDGAYRVGPGDSLNRMLMHMLFVAGLALIAAAASRPREMAASLSLLGGRRRSEPSVPDGKRNAVANS